MMREALWFTAPREVAVRQEALPAPQAGEVVVEAIVSAVSPGTEMLFYRGDVPTGMAVDATIDGMDSAVAYPLTYGYALVGKVVELGAEVDKTWLGREVFLFHPHASHAVVGVDQLMPLPEGMAPETAVFLPNMETAVSFLMDARPMIGEQVLVMGLGIVGLLTTALLTALPLASLVAVDRFAMRREMALELGVSAVVDPAADAFVRQTRDALQGSRPYTGADLVFELTGNPAALDSAIELSGFNSRVLVGSWYGSKQAPLRLGEQFHRSHMRLISSQVSTIAPQWAGRFSKARRLQMAWQMLNAVRPDRFVTQRMPLSQAAVAYDRIDREPASAVQLLFTYAQSR